VGTGARLEAGVRLLERTRLPMRDLTPAMVGAGAKVGGGAVICGGNKVGKRAVVGAGETVEDDVPDDATWMGGRVIAELDEREW
jgi:serine acetyltransferase